MSCVTCGSAYSKNFGARLGQRSLRADFRRRWQFNSCCKANISSAHRDATGYAIQIFCLSGLPDLTYPLHDRDVLVTACGRICMHRKRVNISTVLAGQRLGIKEVDDRIWIVSFMHYDLGFIDLEQKTLQPLDNPSAQGCHPCLRYVLLPMSPVRTYFRWSGRGDSNPRPQPWQGCALPLSYTRIRPR